MSVTPMAHQVVMANSWAQHPDGLCFNTSDPGTGKTIGTLLGFDRCPDIIDSKNKRMLILAPLSILEASWLMDVEKFGTYKATIAHGAKAKREKALADTRYDVVITNHDAVKWIVKNPDLVAGFTHLVVDESTAYKNSQAQRTDAAMKLRSHFSYVTLLTGTPNPNSVIDLWSQTALLDGGQRLGKSFFRFRATCCDPVQVGPDPHMRQWKDKEGALDYCMDMLKDVVVRFRMEDCIDIPENVTHEYFIDMPAALAKAYNEFERRAIYENDGGKVSGVNAAILVKKLLQMLSGAIYDENGEVVKVHTERYDLVMQLVSERSASLVAYNWQHELDSMVSIAEKMKISYGVINGKATPKQRNQAVQDFQNGKLQVVFAHPAAAAHGLTLTRGVATIWASPTYSSEHYQQFNRRIYRNGQTKKTETIRVGYRGSREEGVYQKLDGKLENMGDLLSLFTQLNQVRKSA